MTSISKKYCTVLISGKPNVGKSTLFNKLIHDKISATSNKANTTKEFRYAYSTNKNQQIQYIDTPGYNNAKVTQLIQQVSVVLIVTTPDRWVEIDAKFAAICQEYQVPTILIVNKVDNLREWSSLEAWSTPIVNQYKLKDVLYISAKQGHHLNLLEKSLQRYMLNTEVIIRDILPTLEQRVQEIITEKLFRTLHQEIPHNLKVDVHVVDQTIWGFITFYKASHKKILLGKSGRTISLLTELCKKDIQTILQISQDFKIHLKGSL
jgi:GTPase